jgi:DNA replication protein DnaC
MLGGAPRDQRLHAAAKFFGDEVTAAAMIDRLVHHAEILALKGDSYRLKDRDLARPARDD